MLFDAERSAGEETERERERQGRREPFTLISSHHGGFARIQHPTSRANGRTSGSECYWGHSQADSAEKFSC